MADVIPIKPPGQPPPAREKKKRRPAEPFSRVDAMLLEHQLRVYEACAVIGSIAWRMHRNDGRIDDDERMQVTYALDGVLHILAPVAAIDSFGDLVEQDKERRKLKNAWK